jgi:hypothetical protein
MKIMKAKNIKTKKHAKLNYIVRGPRAINVFIRIQELDLKILRKQ